MIFYEGDIVGKMNRPDDVFRFIRYLEKDELSDFDIVYNIDCVATSDLRDAPSTIRDDRWMLASKCIFIISSVRRVILTETI